MPKLSILIPSRNEAYLYPTIRDCFAKAAGEIEVVVHLDGYWPSDWKTMTDAYPNLHTVHSGEAVGMRPGLNKAAGSAISRGAKYLLKLDAHVMLDEGYDAKLLADIDDDWIVVPRRKRLDAENWTLQDVGKPDIDYHYLSFPDDPDDFGGPGLNGKPWTQRIIERKDKPEYEIDDECSSQGSAWLMSADYFRRLELMDTVSYGPFWNEAQELFLKCWLSGGRGVINKKTWYAHLRKGKQYIGSTGQQGRGYSLPESWLKFGRDHTMKWIYNEAWSKQTLPFKWLIEKFPNMPGWPDNWEEVLYAQRKPRMVPVGGLVNTVDTGNDSTQSPSSLNIYSAYYGIGPYVGQCVDVTERLRELAKDGSLDIVVNNSTLTPNQNLFRGKKKYLVVVYSIDKGEDIKRRIEEKDWLIIGPVGERAANTAQLGVTQAATYIEANKEGLATVSATLGSEETARLVSKRDGREDEVRPRLKCAICGRLTDSLMAPIAEANEGVCSEDCAEKWIEQHGTEPIRLLPQSAPMTATALNDYLIRRFSISPQRLRGPMPIELRDFHRNDLAQLFAELGFKRGAEIGVAEGNYSEILLKANPECELLLVDPWHHYSDNPQGKSKEKHEFAYTEMTRKVMGYQHVKVKMQYSMDAVRDVDDNSLDFCYIDGAHSFNYVLMDIICWSQKVRSGGIIALDDYFFIDRKRWGAGVVEAVQSFTSAHQINPWFTCDAHRSVDAFWVNP